jgi:glycosyltransferase involved in cell wall biosynthesis
MRALPELLRARPNARVLLVGADDVSYGARPDEKKYGTSKWKDVFINEVRSQITDQDWQRVHFLGHIPYQYFIPLLQLSTVHVYLTYPFVLSWSLLEAMSAGCAIVASDTQPLKEAIVHNETGMLIDFFDPKALVESVVKLLDSPSDRQRLSDNSRKFAQSHYDLQNVCLPKQIEWVTSLASRAG